MDTITVETPGGPGRVFVSAPTRPRAALLLGHGAGGGIEAFDLEALAAHLPGAGIAVLRFEQPWRTAGRKIAGRPATLDQAWESALEHATAAFPGLPLLVGGRSAGARVACRRFASPAIGVVCLSFPLHPPGKPEASRIGELSGVAGPVLVIQGGRDPFGSAEELRAALAAAGDPALDRFRLIDIPGATHSFAPRTVAAREASDQLGRSLASHVTDFVDALIG
ncbi:MAG: hydrolase [Micropruina sp.]|nr:hydrolase [Micropruina sp.]